MAAQQHEHRLELGAGLGLKCGVQEHGTLQPSQAEPVGGGVDGWLGG